MALCFQITCRYLNIQHFSRSVLLTTMLPPRFTCNLCHRFKFSKQSLHTSSVSLKKKEDRKMLKEIDPEGKFRRGSPINFRPKKDISKRKHVWVGITAMQISEQVQRNIDDVFEVMLFVKGSETYMEPNIAIYDSKIIKEIVDKLGYSGFFITNPNKPKDVEEDLDVRKRPPADEKDLIKRPPVVTIMGHVDHGKTTLLDALRHTRVVDQEFGGITQHIGAFSVPLSTGENITFLDTPGHAAFSAMRARGAHVTDIVVLVVAADDGVMEQTLESIRYSNEANVPIIVAINKCDKPQANVDKAKKELLQHGVVLEDFGGDVQSVCISALKGEGLDLLQETIITQAEIMDLKADPKGIVEGVVIESRTDLGRGRLSTAVIQRGTLKKGCYLVAGTAWAKVRGMFDSNSHPVQEAPPSSPVEIIGWRELPSAGDDIIEVESENQVRKVIKYRENQIMKEKMDDDALVIRLKLEEHLKVYKVELEKKRLLGRRKRIHGPKIKEYEEKEGPQLALIIKGDVDGSVEAILDVIETYNSKKCDLDMIHYGVGMITESDVELAFPFKGIIYGFNVTANEDVKKLAISRNVTIKMFNIIYKLVDDLKAELNQRLPSVPEDEEIGRANVLEEFLVNVGNKKVPVAGCRCEKGQLQKNGLFKVIRGSEVLFKEGKILTLKHFKEEVNTITKNMECGISFKDSDLRFQQSDQIICYSTKQVSQTIDWHPAGF